MIAYVCVSILVRMFHVDSWKLSVYKCVCVCVCVVKVNVHVHICKELYPRSKGCNSGYSLLLSEPTIP